MNLKQEAIEELKREGREAAKREHKRLHTNILRAEKALEDAKKDAEKFDEDDFMTRFILEYGMARLRA